MLWMVEPSLRALPRQLSCLGALPLDSGALSEDIWAYAWVLHVASPGQGHGPEYVAIVSASLIAFIHVF